jgi:hypothetical protein
VKDLHFGFYRNTIGKEQLKVLVGGQAKKHLKPLTEISYKVKMPFCVQYT